MTEQRRGVSQGSSLGTAEETHRDEASIARPASEYYGQQDAEEFWAAASLEREPARQRWYLPLLLIFIVLSVPWYHEAGSMGRIVWGLPLWVWTSLLCAFGVASLTALAAVRFWRERD